MIIELLTDSPLDGRWHRIRPPGSYEPGPVATVSVADPDTASAAGVVEFFEGRDVYGDRMRVLDASKVHHLDTAVTL